MHVLLSRICKKGIKIYQLMKWSDRVQIFQSTNECEKRLNNEIEKIRKSMEDFIHKSKVQEVDAKVKALSNFRAESYEMMNQIQHEWLAVSAVKYLLDMNSIKEIEKEKYSVEWNPRQTGKKSEPNIRVFIKETKTIINCECTSSKEPLGVIDTRIRKDLESLSEMNGVKYYFVISDSMKKRAETKIRKKGFAIEVVKL